MDLTTRAYLLGGFVVFIIVTALVILAIGKKIQTDSDAADTFDVGKDMKKEQKRRAREEKKLAKQNKSKKEPKQSKEQKNGTKTDTTASRSGVKSLVANGSATGASAFAAEEESFDDLNSATTAFGQKNPQSSTPAAQPSAGFAPATPHGSSIYDSPEARNQPVAPPAPNNVATPPPSSPAEINEQAPKIPPTNPNAASPFGVSDSGEDEW